MDWICSIKADICSFDESDSVKDLPFQIAMGKSKTETNLKEEIQSLDAAHLLESEEKASVDGLIIEYWEDLIFMCWNKTQKDIKMCLYVWTVTIFNHVFQESPVFLV